MLIANPIYDIVFKRLMENERVAKFFIGTMLNTTVESLEVRPQEFSYMDELIGIRLFRLDFVAVIQTKNGESQKVLIEIQKAKNRVDIMRFRNYLAEQYKKKDKVDGKEKPLPLTTIYLLGFKLPEVKTACVHVERQYKDLINDGAILNIKSGFIESLTHDSYVVQINRITGRYKTRLDKLLSIFEQAYFIDEKEVIKDFPYDIDNDVLKIATDILHYSGADATTRKQLEVEQEAWRTIDAFFEDEREDLQQKLEKREQIIFEKEQEISEKDKELSEIQKALEAQAKLIEELQNKLNEK